MQYIVIKTFLQRSKPLVLPLDLLDCYNERF